MPPTAQKEAKNEVDVLRCLKHPNIVSYCDSFMSGRMLCIVMEFADAGDLSQLIKRKRSINEKLRENEVLPIFVQCCLALHYVHKQHILHRDLKSQNIFMMLSGVVKLGDFGIAKVLDHTAAEAITVIGTPIYLAPEVCHSKPYGIKADVWSIGVVLYELLALAPPFTGTNMAALMNNIVTATPKELPDFYAQDLRNLAFEILQKAPEARPTVAAILDRALVREVAEAMPGWALFQPAVEVFEDVTMPAMPRAECRQAAEIAPEFSEDRKCGDLRRRPPLPMPDSARLASEYRQNREAALAAKARVLGRTGQRSLSAEPALSAASSAASPCERAAREAEHLLALQQAAAQARRDRQHVQQRIQAEKEANAAKYHLETLDEKFERPSRANEKHLADLQEAAAQARKDRRLVQQKIRDLDKNSDNYQISWNLTELQEQEEHFNPQGHSPRRGRENEEEHLLALQEARAQARRDRKSLDAKRRALEEREEAAPWSEPSEAAPSTPTREVRELSEAKHVQALKEAAAEARRERKVLQQKAQQEILDDLYQVPGSFGNQDRPNSGDSEDRAKRILAAKAEAQRLEEEKRYRELREASAQARRERKFLQQKVREIEWGDGQAEDGSRISRCLDSHSSERTQRSRSRLSTLGLAGRLSFSRPASEERSLPSEREESPSPSLQPLRNLHISAPPGDSLQVPAVPCL